MVAVRLWYAFRLRESRRIMYEKMLNRLRSSSMEHSLPRVWRLRSEKRDSMSSRPP